MKFMEKGKFPFPLLKIKKWRINESNYYTKYIK